MSDTHAINIVRAAIAVLDAHTTPNAIAQFLESEDIKGVRKDACSCPIAIWIDRKLLEGDCVDYFVLVNANWITLEIKTESDTFNKMIGEVSFSHLSPLGRFLDKLDGGLYSKLIVN